MTPSISIQTLEDSEVIIEGELSAETFDKHRGEAVKRLGARIEIPGFRKGHVPEKILAGKLGEPAILEKMAELALAAVYPNIIKENKIDAIGQPNITITKLATGNPLGFKIQTAVMPNVILGDYKKAAKKTFSKNKSETVSVSDEEMERAITQLRSVADGETENLDKLRTNNTKTELTNEFVQKLGKFKDIADFKVKLRENIKREKEMRSKEAQRLECIDTIIQKSTIPLPSILVETELNKMVVRFEHDISRMGMKLADYLKRIKKTEEDLRREWKPDAQKRAKIQLILNAVASIEHIEGDMQTVDKEINHILEHHKNANKEQVEIYVKTLLTNERVLEFLESQT